MSTNVLTYRYNWLSFFAGAVLWVAVYVQAWMELFYVNFHTAAVDAAISTVILIVLIYTLSNILRFYQPALNKEVLAFGGASVGGAIYAFVTEPIVNSLLPQAELLVHASWLRFAIGFLVLLSTIIINMVWKQLMEQEMRGARAEETERIARDAELFKLRHQLQPHFLFNSLNSINALIRTKPEEARKMVQHLSEFLRGTLKQEEKSFISLGDEIAYLELYLTIEKVRFGHRLQTTIELTEEAAVVRIPPLLLQPLMENAIKFGLYGTTEKVMIHLQAFLEEGALLLAISNPMDEEAKSSAGTGFGLKSIARRLFLIYNRSDLLETRATNGTFTATLKIPIQ